MAEKETKKLSVADLARKMCKEYSNNNLIIKSDVVPAYKRLSSGMMGSDYPLYGGLPYGRLAVYAGLEHSGKTTAACAQLAAYQRENPDKLCVYVDVEHSLDIQFQALPFAPTRAERGTGRHPPRSRSEPQPRKRSRIPPRSPAQTRSRPRPSRWSRRSAQDRIP